MSCVGIASCVSCLFAQRSALTDITTQHVQVDVDVALSNSFGFGGHNSCVLFSKYAA